jgi:HTH-type transcriptional regulator, sugar sensing transcriptional regulator
VEQSAVETMKALGFTSSEAKAYIALLQNQPATGYEIAASSGVPRSAIYNVLKRLESMGLANAVEEKPTRYAALPVTRLYGLLEGRFGGRLQRLRQALDDLVTPPGNTFLWQFQGYRSILDAAQGLIANAERSVAASLWYREAEALTEALRTAQAQERHVVLYSFTSLPPGLGETFAYGIPERLLEPHWAHRLILVVDGQKALVGETELGESSQAVLTENPAIVEMAVNNLVLDITLFGKREGVPTSEAIGWLQDHLAPIDELLAQRASR